jgi:hypothetical protein
MPHGLRTRQHVALERTEIVWSNKLYYIKYERFIQLSTTDIRIKGNNMCLFSGSVAQLLDSLEEVQILSQAKKNDIDFLHRFFDNNKFQSLLEVRSYIFIR